LSKQHPNLFSTHEKPTARTRFLQPADYWKSKFLWVYSTTVVP